MYDDNHIIIIIIVIIVINVPAASEAGPPTPPRSHIRTGAIYKYNYYYIILGASMKSNTLLCYIVFVL